MQLAHQSNRCNGCRMCMLACSAHKEGIFNPAYSRMKVDTRYTGETVEEVAGVCNMCLICLNECPEEAIDLQDNRLVYLEDKCTNCGLCVEKCPEQVITQKSASVGICDLCLTCIEWCPQDAIFLKGA